jgi:hypothetical protein
MAYGWSELVCEYGFTHDWVVTDTGKPILLTTCGKPEHHEAVAYRKAAARDDQLSDAEVNYLVWRVRPYPAC